MVICEYVNIVPVNCLNKTSATGAHRIPITIPIPILFYFLLSQKFAVNKVKG
jgi:hypothetical protein